MTAASNYLENAVLDHVFRNTTLTSPTTVYVKMHTGGPGEDCTSNPATETTRKALTFAAASGGSIAATGTPVASWTSLAATETWTHFSIWDHLTAGNPLAYAALDASMAVTSGGNAQLDSITVTQT